MDIYLSCGLTHVPRELFHEYCNYIHLIAHKLYKKGHLIKYALVDSDPQLARKQEDEKALLCYLWDRKMVEMADVLIAEASFPSIGLGIELQVAENKDIPVILCYKDFGLNRALPVKYENPNSESNDLQIGEGYISLMALGLPNIYKIVKYVDFESGSSEILSLVETLRK